MSQHLSINQRREFGKPPSHYKNTGKNVDFPKMKPPDINMLTSGDRDYHLVIQG